MVHLLNRTPLAAIEFNDDNGKHLRVFCQSPQGDIIEVLYDQKGGWKGPSKYVVGRGKLNTGIAAISSPDGKHIRVYFLDEHYRIVERVYKGHSGGLLGGVSDSNPWTDGPLTGKFHAAPYSRLGAICLDKGEQLRVFFQDKSNKLKELIYKENQGWKESTSKLPTALAGTSIAAAHNPDHEYRGQMWLYFQSPELKLQEISNNGKDDNWKEGSFKSNKVYPPTCGIAVIMGCNPIKIAVVAVDENNMLVETRFDNGWKSTIDIRESTITDSDVALISLENSKGSHVQSATSAEKIDLRLFFQPAGSNIGEMVSEDGSHWKLTHENVF
ncbi:fucose-specific lectin [Pluteus cervinus]|uniref:Fucose-specific lectin n=1 Tax=Pluteus cervinus TaxID=181527 RepID=A0ACD3ANW1_9AGAR|nr:fucose-specific lectin [Pluteus cervinus]